MKKKLIVLASVAMLSVGAAFYANKSSYINALSENDVEALTETGEGGSAYQVYGSSPNRIIVDNVTHVVIFEGKKQAVNNKNKPINGCSEETGGTCNVSTTTTVYNIGLISDYLVSFFGGVCSAVQSILSLMED